MRFAHISDSHLGFQQYGRQARKDDFAIGLNNAVRDITACGIKLIVHTGDLLNANRPGPETIAVLLRLNHYLIEHKVRMFVISGNHDQTDPHWSFVVKLEPMFHYGLSCVDNQTTTIENISFQCLPFMSVPRFKEQDFKPGNVLLWHGQVSEMLGYPSQHAIPIAELPNIYQLILLGDVHVYRYMEHPNNPNCLVGYPGSTELYRETEDPFKYWADIEIEPGKKPVIQARPFVTRRVIPLKLSEDPADLEVKIPIVKSLVKQHVTDGRMPIMFVDYPSTNPKVLQRIYAEFDPAHYIIQPRPYFPTSIDAPPLPGQPDEDNLTVDEILRRRVATKPELTEIAMQLIKQDINADAAISEYIQARISRISGEAARV